MFSFLNMNDFNLGNEGAVSHRRSKELYRKIHGLDDEDGEREKRDGLRGNERDGKLIREREGLSFPMSGLSKSSDEDAQRWLREKIEAIDAGRNVRVDVQFNEMKKDDPTNTDTSSRDIDSLLRNNPESKTLIEIANKVKNVYEFINTYKKMKKSSLYDERKADEDETLPAETYNDVELRNIYENIRRNTSILDVIVTKMRTKGKKDQIKDWNSFENKWIEWKKRGYTDYIDNVTKVYNGLRVILPDELKRKWEYNLIDFKKMNKQSEEGEEILKLVLYLIHSVSDFKSGVFNKDNVKKLISELKPTAINREKMEKIYDQYMEHNGIYLTSVQEEKRKRR